MYLLQVPTRRKILHHLRQGEDLPTTNLARTILQYASCN